MRNETIFLTVRVAAGLFGVALGFGEPARAAYVVTLTQNGSDTIAKGTGNINITSLNFEPMAKTNEQLMIPSLGVILTGDGGAFDIFSGITGPLNFGQGSLSFATTGTGAPVSMDANLNHIVLPTGYVSGASLTSEAVWAGRSFSSLGITPGSYVWTWGAGATTDSFVLQIGAVPEPMSAALLGAGWLGLGLARRRLSMR